MSTHADYLIHAGEDGARDAADFVPELSRRARGFAIYAALRTLGRNGLAAMVERCCDHAQRFADAFGERSGVDVLVKPVLNQVLVRFIDSDSESDALTRRTIEQVQRDGICWMSGTTWRGQAAMRVSVSNWMTTTTDVDMSVDAMIAARDAVLSSL